MSNLTDDKRLKPREHECECRSFEYYDVDDVDELLAKQDAVLKSVRRWLQMWRTNDIDSSQAMRQIGIDFDVAEKRS